MNTMLVGEILENRNMLSGMTLEEYIVANAGNNFIGPIAPNIEYIYSNATAEGESVDSPPVCGEGEFDDPETELVECIVEEIPPEEDPVVCDDGLIEVRNELGEYECLLAPPPDPTTPSDVGITEIIIDNQINQNANQNSETHIVINTLEDEVLDKVTTCLVDPSVSDAVQTLIDDAHTLQQQAEAAYQNAQNLLDEAYQLNADAGTALANGDSNLADEKYEQSQTKMNEADYQMDLSSDFYILAAQHLAIANALLEVNGCNLDEEHEGDGP